MDDSLKEALAIVKAQASVRQMTEDELVLMLQKLSTSIRTMDSGGETAISASNAPVESAKAIKEKSITCLECGKVFKVLTKKHLALHGLTALEYREKWDLKKDVPLVCKGLQRERRKKMKEMKLWEKRKKAKVGQAA